MVRNSPPSVTSNNPFVWLHIVYPQSRESPHTWPTEPFMWLAWNVVCPAGCGKGVLKSPRFVPSKSLLPCNSVAYPLPKSLCVSYSWLIAELTSMRSIPLSKPHHRLPLLSNFKESIVLFCKPFAVVTYCASRPSRSVMATPPRWSLRYIFVVNSNTEEAVFCHIVIGLRLLPSYLSVMVDIESRVCGGN